MVELDLDNDNEISPIKKSNIDITDITGEILFDKITNIEPLETIKISLSKKGVIEQSQFNTAMFIMEGSGYVVKYWLCVGINCIGNIIAMSDVFSKNDYNDIVYGGNKKALEFYGLPLFFNIGNEELKNSLFLITDIKQKETKTVRFNFLSGKTQSKKKKKSTTKTIDEELGCPSYTILDSDNYKKWIPSTGWTCKKGTGKPFPELATENAGMKYQTQLKKEIEKQLLKIEQTKTDPAFFIDNKGKITSLTNTEKEAMKKKWKDKYATIKGSKSPMKSFSEEYAENSKKIETYEKKKNKTKQEDDIPF